MRLIGRNREKDVLMQCTESKRPEFLVVYGRRRVGKTYLVREFFGGRFSFYATGYAEKKTDAQLKAFHESLTAYGDSHTRAPEDWFEAFRRLRELLSAQEVYREPNCQKRLVFLDELPWMDTARSDFKGALDYFWNSWGSAQEDLLFIVCGSATSWIIEHLLMDTGGFYHRVTRRILLEPFSLRECEELLSFNGIAWTRAQQTECYMVFGGIPYYLNLLDSRYSLAQNIEELCFKSYGELKNEFDILFRSLFKKPEKHIAIIRSLSKRRQGMTRKELSGEKAVGGGSVLTKNLEELEQCGFIRKYRNYVKRKNEAMFQIVDPFTLFSLSFIKKGKTDSWLGYHNTPGYYAWRGNSFEMVCLNHIPQIKDALGISGVGTQEYAWRSRDAMHGAQIDLLIDRNDGIINLCEMKYTNGEYEISREEHHNLENRRAVFQRETNCKKAVHILLISATDVKRGMYADIAQNMITGDMLFT